MGLMGGERGKTRSRERGYTWDVLVLQGAIDSAPIID
jgi:hypothetical protein